MAATEILGGGQSGAPQVIAGAQKLAVDPLYLAARVALRPLDYTASGALLGHYAVAQKSGATVSLGAAGHIGRIRWAPASNANNTFCVLLRLKVGYSVITAVTTAVPMEFDAIIHRGYTVDHTAAITNINMSSVPRTNAMRSGAGLTAMQSSQMGTSGPGICTTVVISGNTSTADNAPFAIQALPNLSSSTSTGTAVALQAGTSGGMVTLYDCTAAGQHPVVLSNQEGVVVRHVGAGPASGTTSLYLQWEWAEVSVL